MKTQKKFKEWMTEHNYTLREVSLDQYRYFANFHRLSDKGMHDGMVCKFTGKIYEVYDFTCDQHIGYAALFKTLSGKVVIDYHRG